MFALAKKGSTSARGPLLAAPRQYHNDLPGLETPRGGEYEDGHCWLCWLALAQLSPDMVVSLSSEYPRGRCSKPKYAINESAYMGLSSRCLKRPDAGLSE